jgi:LisH
MPFDSVHVSRLVYEYLLDNGYPFAADAFANECSELMALKYQPDQHSPESIPPLVGPSLVDVLENYSYIQSKQSKCPATTYPTSPNSDISQSCDSGIHFSYSSCYFSCLITIMLFSYCLHRTIKKFFSFIRVYKL